MTRLLAAVLALAAATGCATHQPFTITKGNGLVTVSVVTPDELATVCQSPNAIACVPHRFDRDGVTVFARLPASSWMVGAREFRDLVEIAAHEGCHVVYQVIVRTARALVAGLAVQAPDGILVIDPALTERFADDPCHREDGGKFHR